MLLLNTNRFKIEKDDTLTSTPSAFKIQLPMDGADNGTVFNNTSKTWKDAKTITVTGSVAVAASQKKLGIASASFTSGSGKILFPAHVDYNFALNQDFTIELWYYPTNITASSYTGLLSGHQAGQLNNYGLTQYTTSVMFTCDGVTAGQVYSSNIVNNTWQHIAVVRKNNVLTLYINGVSQQSKTYPNAISAPGGLVLGPFYYDQVEANNTFTGYIDEVRISKGIARWSENFTPSTTQYETDKYTSLLVHFDGMYNSTGIVDSSFNYRSSKSLTVTGTPKAIIASKGRKGLISVGGSAGYVTTQYKFGTGCLSCAGYILLTHTPDFDFGKKDFTVDFWWRNSGNGSGMHLWSNQSSTNKACIIANGNAIMFYESGVQRITGAITVDNTGWHHIALTRSGDSVRLFYDGNQVGSIWTATGVYIGDAVYNYIGGVSGNASNGHIDEFRVSKGIARWTTTFAVPTAQYTTDYYTVFLSHFDDTNLTDISKSFSIGAGTPSTNQTIKKFGNASLYLDGSSYITTPDSDDYKFRYTDFTIECWVYPTTYTGASGTVIVSNCNIGGGGLGWNLWLWMNDAATQSICFTGQYVSTAWAFDIRKTTPIALNAWSHIAVVKVNSVIKLFVNGVMVQSISNATDINWTSPFLPLNIGADGLGNFKFTGYIDEVRISNSPRWTSDFTPQTAPYGDPDFNTMLLMHMNGTAGGTTFLPELSFYRCASFDSTVGSYINVSASNDLLLSNKGDFTVEGWFHTDGNTFPQDQYGMLYSIGSDTNNYMQVFISTVYENTSNINLCIRFNNGGTVTSAYNTFWYKPNGWNHFAITRKDGLVYIFMNGLNAASGVTLTSEVGNGWGSIRVGGDLTSGAYNQFRGLLSEIKISNVARYTSKFIPSTSISDTDLNTLLLLHFDNAYPSNQYISTSPIDSSGLQKTFTAVGSAVTKTDNKINGTCSLYLNGTAGYIYINQCDQAELRDSDFTIECYIYLTSLVSSGHIFKTLISSIDAGNNTGYYLVLYPSTGIGGNLDRIIFAMGSSVYPYALSMACDKGASFNAHQWYHIAVQRNKTSITIFKDGTSLGSLSMPAQYAIGSSGKSILSIGSESNDASNRTMTGYIDDFKIYNGYAKYTSNWSSGNDKFTTFLLHGDGANNGTTFIDASYKNVTLTKTGTVTTSTTQKPFSYSSVYFDGSGGYLDTATNTDYETGSGDFTIDFWMYATIAPPTYNCVVISKGDNNNGALSNYWFFNYTTQWYFMCGNGTNTGYWNYGTPTANKWYHHAIVRSGNTMYFYTNGVYATSASAITYPNFSGNLGSNGIPLRIGARYNINNFVNYTGYLKEVRVSKGIARWTGNITFNPLTKPYM